MALVVGKATITHWACDICGKRKGRYTLHYEVSGLQYIGSFKTPNNKHPFSHLYLCSKKCIEMAKLINAEKI